MKLIDRVHHRYRFELPSGLQVIEATNVADYVLEKEKREHLGSWDYATEFPNVAPPFKDFWVEFRIMAGKPERPVNVGWLVSSFDADPIEHPGARWIMGMRLVVEVPNHSPEMFGVCRYRMIGPNGEIMAATSDLQRTEDEDVEGQEVGDAIRQGRATGWYTVASREEVARLWGDWPAMVRYYRMAAIPLFAAICFMNCRNVKLVEHGPPKSWGEKRRRSFGIRFHTIEISPIRKVLDSAMAATSCGIHQALHICRGHFKDYRESGLFGKYKGIFWWDQVVRGHVEEGVSLHDYRIQ